jgi:hypothetical protein
MSLPSQAHLCLLPVLLVFSAVCIAGTLSSVDMQASGTFSSGPPTGCGQASSSSAAYADAVQNNFGANFVSVQGGGSAEFTDPVLVTGGAGTGTLVADFSWSASAWVAIGEVIWPSFTVVVGTSGQSWTLR